MALYFHQFIYQIGFWFTWLLIPIVVEIIPAVSHALTLQRTVKASKQYQVPLKMPMISIVLPVYNSEQTLYQCISSIAASSYPKQLIQIIVANNHSTDNSFQVFHQAQADFPDLRLQWMNTDAGKARALNAAIYNSMGSYVMNLDTDGWLEPEALLNMVLYFENNSQIDAATGTILTQKEAIAATQKKGLKLLQRNEYFEYAQAFLSGRSIESQNNRLFTMSGAFSAFRREVLVQTYMYNVDTIGEDTDMTFQLRYRLGKRIGFVVDAIFYVEPISGLEELYLQRQRWQRGQIEVAQNFLQKKLNVNQIFSNFMIGRLMVDHTFVFPRLIWMIGLGMLVYLGYSPIVVSLSLMMMYLLYVLFGLLNYLSSMQLLKKFDEERLYYRKQWPLMLTLPLYNGINTAIRLVGIINAMTSRANWQTKKFSVEIAEIKAIIFSDFTLKKKGKK
ncbi:putative glycosyltransferase, exosortase G system-associated [Leuconostoc holzapfelii]|uniref:Glycosyltransferase, exosortase G system-associated n=1 Tax=Leuconostoc holzapfelii TaxID=434464 RepID=A0ABT2NT91_9LACO|nr:TIGR03111 family XrtG-associated glycosyltransferase [Leuconostoc holzapfelii]MCT8388571.1 putative glycosyltransferase, exosortase G system-associated [Leuconostoc holzapfelii]